MEGGSELIVAFLVSVLLQLFAESHALALKKYKPSLKELKLTNRGDVVEFEEFISAVELYNLIVILAKLVSLILTLTIILFLAIVVPDVSVGFVKLIVGLIVSLRKVSEELF
jgi:hypothetical protein